MVIELERSHFDSRSNLLSQVWHRLSLVPSPSFSVWDEREEGLGDNPE